MTPAARVAGAIEVLDSWLAGSDGLDMCLLRWGRARRFAGSGDRRAIADLVYDAVRRMRSAAWVAGASGPSTGRALLHGSLLLDGADLASLFNGQGHGPAPLRGAEISACRPLAGCPERVALDLPDWMADVLPDAGVSGLAELRSRAPVDLRVNRLRSDPAQAAEVLAGEGIGTMAIEGVPSGLRVTEGARRIGQSRAYLEGLVEVQDAASQAATTLAGAGPGMTVVDLCAGGGGKTLAVAADLCGDGRVLAHDISAARMADLAPRAARAGARVEILTPGGLAAVAGRCDLALVDAPCSGSGAWRRNPDAKWRLTAARLEELMQIQAALLTQAATCCVPGGRIAFMTCSVLPCENVAQIDGFLAARADWQLERMQSLAVGAPGDGFFVAILRHLDTR